MTGETTPVAMRHAGEVSVEEQRFVPQQQFVSALAVLEAFANAAPIDPARFRADIDRPFTSPDSAT